MIIDKSELEALLPWAELIDAIERQFIEGCEVPPRHHHTIPTTTQQDATLLLMPSYQVGEYLGLKVVNVFPDNTSVGLPSITASYMLYSGKTGELLAMMDGSVLTARRTAAAAALGVKHLSNPDASSLFLVGAGRVAALVPEAFGAVRPIKSVKVWNHTQENAEKLVSDLQQRGFDASLEMDLEAGVKSSDLISCATLSTTPLIKGDWLQSGQHVDLIGSFRPVMRETDDKAMQVSRVFIDTQTAFSETGDIIEPLKSGAIDKSHILGDLMELCRGQVPGRVSFDDITVFKAVGTALEDLATAKLAYSKKE